MSTPAALHSKERTEWGTPYEVVEGARKVMGSIDFDLCSSAYWNKHVVRAPQFWSAEGDDALAAARNPSRGFPHGNYLCNPPGGLVVEFWDLCLRLASEGSTVFWVGFSVEQMAYLQDRQLFSTSFLRAIPRARLKFLERRGFLDSRRRDSPPVPAGRPSHSNFLVLMSLAGGVGPMRHAFEAFAFELRAVVF